MNLLCIIVVIVVSLVQVFAVKSKDESNPPKWMLRLANITKPLIMPSLIWLYVTFAKERNNVLIAGMCAGWLGDIALMIQPNKKVGDIMFGVGLLCFLTGHVLYSILFFSQSYPLFETNVLYVLLYLPYLLYCLILYSYIFVPQTPVSLKIGSIVYSLGLTMMSLAGLSVLIKTPSFSTALLFVGTLLFVSSDSVLALREIGKREQMPEQYILASYIVAQMFIVMGNLS